MGLKLYNTLSRKQEEFKPIEDNKVGFYACGPTVYQYAHIGNLRTYIFEDILHRVLEFNGYEVELVMNITDVGHLTSDADTGDDKVEQEARRSGESAWELSQRYTHAFIEDLKKLNILLPDIMPKATDHIEDQIELIKILEEKGFTYQTKSGVYFDTSKVKDYGKLAKLNLKGQKAGARVEEDEEKKSAFDFALWKFSQTPGKRQMEWDSPWGLGFPGWHIECSAMSTKYLGQPFDIHTGGIDHIPVHHTNEIAQSESAFGTPLANFFLHSEFLLWGKDKMSKSLGNIATLSELEDKKYDPLSYRYLILTASYHSKIEFSFQALDAAQNALERLNHLVRSLPEPGQINKSFETEFKAAINDDLDTPASLALMWKLIGSNLPQEVLAATLFRFDEVLGLGLRQVWENSREIPKQVQDLLVKRDEARSRRDFHESDKLRSEIEKQGFLIEDSDSGSKVIKQKS